MKEYIEKATALNLLKKINPVDFGSIFDYEAHGAVQECLREISYRVEDMPTVDVEEVRHGRWIKHKYFDERSECYAMAIFRHNYCPNCGVRMDKEDGHEAN